MISKNTIKQVAFYTILATKDGYSMKFGSKSRVAYDYLKKNVAPEKWEIVKKVFKHFGKMDKSNELIALAQQSIEQ